VCAGADAVSRSVICRGWRQGRILRRGRVLEGKGWALAEAARICAVQAWRDGERRRKLGIPCLGLVEDWALHGEAR